MKLKASFTKFLTNKWVLNTVFIVALLNMIGFVVMGDFTSVVYFIVLALLISYFSKNMIIILGIPIIFVNLLAATNKNTVSEGMENKSDKEPKKETKKESFNSKNSNKNNKQNKKTAQGLPTTPVKDDPVVPLDDSNENTNAATDESFEVGRAKQRGGYNIDYASTVEDAYDELNKILGSDGIKRLTDDTQSLMKQQLQLAESMKSMEPFIKNMGPMMEQAQSMLKGMGNNKEGLGNIMEMAKKLTGGSSQ
jgi:hypothetical protein